MRKLNKRQQKLLISSVAGLVIFLLGGLTANDTNFQQTLINNSPGSYRVVRVNDGDTLTIDMDGTEERVRMIGVDTPETQDPRKPVQCFGRAATAFTKQLVGKSEQVRLVADELSSNRDRYNRLLRYVYLADDRLLQEEIIKQGYGFAYTNFPFTKSEEFKKLEREARENNRGLWNSCDPEITEEGFKSTNPE